MTAEYQKGSITLFDGIAMGTGVMIGAGIFALTGQIAELAGPWFPAAFLVGAIVTAFSAYSYIKVSNAFPSAGGIGMILHKAYGTGAVAAGAALLMAFSMVINQSLVARTFGTYVLRPFDGAVDPRLVPVLGVGLILVAFLVNLSGNRLVGTASVVMALIKVGGIALLALAALWASGVDPEMWGEMWGAPGETGAFDTTVTGFVASVALAVLAFKGFTTITNSGAEITNPHRNVGRAIILSILICVVVYLLIAFAVGSSLPLRDIVAAKNYALAEAAKPSLGIYGFYVTVVLAVIATASGIIASVFAVSRMLAMLTDMKMIPHSHFGMPGHVRGHMLVYTVVLAALLSVFFDLTRIASLGVFFYLVMDIVVHVGVLRTLRAATGANPVIVLSAIGFDTVVLIAFGWLKWSSDPLILAVALVGILSVFAYQRYYLSRWLGPEGGKPHGTHEGR
ncbi:MAG: APC family permease [Alphaproteobacteria bacterium]|nr:APC family permease [Alphaproteobacteria bacterium]